MNIPAGTTAPVLESIIKSTTTITTTTTSTTTTSLQLGTPLPLTKPPVITTRKSWFMVL
jgi:hypothetical protein